MTKLNRDLGKNAVRHQIKKQLLLIKQITKQLNIQQQGLPKENISRKTKFRQISKSSLDFMLIRTSTTKKVRDFGSCLPDSFT